MKNPFRETYYSDKNWTNRLWLHILGQSARAVRLLPKPGTVQKKGTALGQGFFSVWEGLLLEGKDCILTLQGRKKQGDQAVAGCNAVTQQVESLAKTKARLQRPALQNPKTTSQPSAPQHIATAAWVRQFVEGYAFVPRVVSGVWVRISQNGLTLGWNDPADFYYEDRLLAAWKGTRVVYRTDRYPQNPQDGHHLITSTTRGYYAVSGKELAVELGTTCYFSLFPYNSAGAYNCHPSQRGALRRAGLASLPSLPHPVSGAAAATNGSGWVVVAGGNAAGLVHNAVAAYDPQGRRRDLAPMEFYRGAMVAARCGPYALFAGGLRPSLAMSPVVEVYDAAGNRGRWADMQCPRYFAAAANWARGALIAGGSTNKYADRCQDAVDGYSEQGVRSTMTPLALARYGLAGAGTVHGHCLFLGGWRVDGPRAEVDVYDGAGVRSVWTPLALARGVMAAAADSRGYVLCGGGSRTFLGAAVEEYSNAVDMYSPTGVRSTLPPLAMGRAGLAAAQGPEGQVYFCGGYSNLGLCNLVETYSAAGVRSTAAVMPTARVYPAAAQDGWGRLVIAGGGVALGQAEMNTGYTDVDKYF